MISSSVIILLSSSATSPRSSFVPLDAIETHTCTAGCEGGFICCVYSAADSLMWKIFCQKKKKERKKRTFSFWLTIYGVLCVKVSSPLHLIWRHSERRVITNPFTFTSHYYLISETMCQSSQRPLILWLPGINICRNTRKARLKLWHRCENSWK